MRDGGGSTFFKDLLFRRMRFVRTHKNLTPIARNCQKRYCENWFLTVLYNIYDKFLKNISRL
ncbi:unnamed protein product [Tenebrio molitor]|nr:unnamed protein product [Tenebrio molitor]